MKSLNVVKTSLSQLSFKGTVSNARVEKGFFQESTRLTRFTEEVYRWKLITVTQPKQLCVPNNNNIHILSTHSNFGIFSLINNEQVFLNLDDSLPGGGQGNVQLKPFLNRLAYYIPSYDTLFLLNPYGGKCDLFRLGKYSYRQQLNDISMFQSNDTLYLCGENSLRMIVGTEKLVQVEIPVNGVVRPLSGTEFLVFDKKSSKIKGMISLGQTKEWVWSPISVENQTGENREWSSNKTGISKSSYLQKLKSIAPGTWEVSTSARPGISTFEQWSDSLNYVASFSNETRMLEVVNLTTEGVKTIEVAKIEENNSSQLTSITSLSLVGDYVYLLETSNEATWVRVFQINDELLNKDFRDWKQMWGIPTQEEKDRRNNLQASKTPPKASDPKHGKVDDKEHFGGNQWAGGTGGSDTAGLGGRAGPYRLDKGFDIHQLSDELKRDVDKEILEKARVLGKQAWEERLKEIQMNPNAHSSYIQARGRVETDLAQLKAVLETASLANKERLWERNQSYGELDDSKLVDGLVGERLIYKRRAFKEPNPGSLPTSPLNIRIVVDISASMYRFQSLDGRLERMIDTTLMLLESFEGLEHRFRISIVGHSGESPTVQLVDWDQIPKDEGGIFKILETMSAHAQFCLSGDTTLDAIYNAIENVLDENPESGGLVIVVSDANLRRYGIAPMEIAKAMKVNELVKTHLIFIASVRDEAEIIKRELPFGRTKICLNTSDLPHVMRDILSESSNS